MLKILIAEDDRELRQLFTHVLAKNGYSVKGVGNGKEALDALEKDYYDLLISDIMMPEMDGMQTLIRLRENRNIPVIFITAKSEDSDMILGLNMGADDYITKPFKPIEVIARVKSHLRRYMELGSAELKKDVLTIGDITVDDAAKEVMFMDEKVSLTPKEYGILKFLMENPGRVFTLSEIYKEVWAEDPFGSEGTVAVHIRHLREKLEIDPDKPRHLKVVWGQGYKMEK